MRNAPYGSESVRPGDSATPETFPPHLGRDLSSMPQSLNPLRRRSFLRYGSAALGAGVFSLVQGNRSSRGSAQAQSQPNKVTYATNWYAQAEHGGFYQAVATGIYEQYGLDVTIRMGGPGVNVTQLLIGGAADFVMGSGSSAIRGVAEGLPVVTVAAIFQKDPQILLAHPGVERIEDLKGRPIFLAQSALTNYWPFLRAKYGFSDDQIRPYNFNSGPFLNDKTAGQQGYLTSEPFAIEQEAGFEPVIFLLADYGYDPYATTIATTQRQIATQPDLVQRFVDASIKGWYSYLEDPAPGNVLIQEANPEMSDAQLAYSFAKLQEYGILQSGAAETLGIGAMIDERWQGFFQRMVEVGVFEPETNYTQAYTLKFVNKGIEAYDPEVSES